MVGFFGLWTSLILTENIMSSRWERSLRMSAAMVTHCGGDCRRISDRKWCKCGKHGAQGRDSKFESPGVVLSGHSSKSTVKAYSTRRLVPSHILSIPSIMLREPWKGRQRSLTYGLAFDSHLFSELWPLRSLYRFYWPTSKQVSRTKADGSSILWSYIFRRQFNRHIMSI